MTFFFNLPNKYFIIAVISGLIVSFGITFIGSPMGIDFNNPWVVLIIVIPLSYVLFKLGYQIGNKS